MDPLQLVLIPTRNLHAAMDALFRRPTDLLAVIDWQTRPLFSDRIATNEIFDRSVRTVVIGNTRDIRALAAVVASFDLVNVFEYKVDGRMPYVFSRLPLTVTPVRLKTTLIQLGMYNGRVLGEC